MSRHPESLQDVIEGDIIRSGYHSIVKQLKSQVENVKRPNTPKITKRKAASDEYDPEEIPAEKSARVQDTYGCVNWEPKYLPLSETVESRQEQKEKMKMSEKMSYNTDNLKKFVKSNYYTQRKDIRGKSIDILSQEWPFLINEAGMTNTSALPRAHWCWSCCVFFEGSNNNNIIIIHLI